KRHKEEDVFWPVFNSDYNEWRKKHNHGGDFVIFSKPKLVKLKRPHAGGQHRRTVFHGHGMDRHVDGGISACFHVRAVGQGGSGR
ncbi:MAG: DUF6402 family protein, partial [Azoarcus sp.]|nr:DUF6402 family protein [Azoarcus sp.]